MPTINSLRPLYGFKYFFATQMTSLCSRLTHSFCYLGNMISAGGGCKSAAITRARTAWGKYKYKSSKMAKTVQKLHILGIFLGKYDSFYHATISVGYCESVTGFQEVIGNLYVTS